MTAAPTNCRSAVFASFVLAAIFAALTPNQLRAENALVPPLETLSSYPMNESAGRYETTASGKPAAPASDTTGEDTLVENAWDFANPDSIPGFASTPYPVRSNPQIAD
jgi:hypothetical protein